MTLEDYQKLPKDRDVNGAVFRAVSGAVFWAVGRDVDRDVYWAVRGAVFLAVFDAGYRAVDRAFKEGSNDP